MKYLFFFLSILLFTKISVAQKVELVIPSGHSGGVTDMSFSGDKKLMCTSGSDGSIILWNAQNGLQIKQFQLIKKGEANCTAFSNDGRFIAAGAENMVALIDVQNTTLLDSFHIEGNNTAVAFTPDNKYLLSCGWKGKVTVWRMSDRKQIYQFIPYEGMYDINYKYIAFIKSLAISPDGKKFVLGDDTKDDGLVEFDMPSDDDGWKNIINTRTAQKITVKKLEYVGTGKYLAILTNENALIILDAKTYTELGKIENLSYEEEPEYFSNAYNDNFMYVNFGVDKISKISLPSLKTLKVIKDTGQIHNLYIDKESGYIYATTDNDVISFKDETLKTAVNKFSAATNLNQYAAVSPDGKLLAVNNGDNIIIFDLVTSNIIKKIKHEDHFFNFTYPLQFDHSGKYLYVNEAQKINQWSVADWKLKRAFEHSEMDVITSFKISKDDKYLATCDNGSNEPALKLWSTSAGTMLAAKKFEKGMEDCAFSDDGKMIAIVGLDNLKCFTIPSLANVFEGGEETASSNLVLFTPDANYIYTFQSNAIYATSVAGKSTKLLYSEGEPDIYGYGVFVVEASPDGKSFIVNGPGNSIMRSDFKTGIPFARMNEQNGLVTSISFAGNGSFYATAGKDGQVILRNEKNEMLCSIFTIKDQSDWVVLTPGGHFDATVNAQNKMYYHKSAAILPLSSLFEEFYTPHLLPRLIGGEILPDADVNINDVKQKPLVKIQYAEKQRNLEVDNDVPSYQNTTGTAEITVTASSEDDAIDEIRLFQNGKVLNLATRNLIVEDDKSKTSTKKYTINLLPGNNEIRAIALNTQRTESQADIINVLYNDGTSTNTDVTPVVNNNSNVIVDKIDKNATLYLVVVGINAYKNPKMSLNYALADATAFKDEVEKDAKTVITNIKTYFVTDDAADKKGIINAINSVQQTAKPQDVFVFYYAGHGVIAGNKEFYLVPNDVTDLSNVDEALKEHGIAAKDLQQYAINIQAQKQLFILDACQSAAAFADMLSDDGNQQKNIALVARSTGTHWMAASGAQQFANEFSTLGHGAFTYVLLQALKGEAAYQKMITVDGLKKYMQNSVPALMKKYNGSQQTPASYGFGNDFPLEIIR